jgi:hypothetical protein
MMILSTRYCVEVDIKQNKGKQRKAVPVYRKRLAVCKKWRKAKKDKL